MGFRDAKRLTAGPKVSLNEAYPLFSPALHYMCGGLRTKGASTQVLDRWSKEIHGLYAAGEIAGGVHGTNRLGGNATADCIVFGRLAGKEAACLA
ncbi:MAG: FAD-binding protein [Deltaproteobacteria bacterium]|nr:FAD-binding protein [Deltaproteobacteria bacterium]